MTTPAKLSAMNKARSHRGIANRTDYSGLLREPTLGKTPPRKCAQIVTVDGHSAACASISPVIGSVHCDPCKADFKESATKDLSFTNYRTQGDWR